MGVEFQLLLGLLLFGSICDSEDINLNSSSEKVDSIRNFIEKLPKTDTQIHLISKDTQEDTGDSLKSSKYPTKNDNHQTRALSQEYVDKNGSSSSRNDNRRQNNSRSIDLEKFASSDFRNNDYGFSDNEKFLENTIHRSSTKPFTDFSKFPLTTPEHDYLETKYEETRQKLEQEYADNLPDHFDESDSTKRDDSEQLDHDFNIDRLFGSSNYPNSSFNYKEKTKISRNNTVGDNSHHNELRVLKVKHINFASEFNFTTTDDDDVGSSNNISPHDKQDTTSVPLTTTVKVITLTKPPTNSNSHILNNKIESETIMPLQTEYSTTKRLNDENEITPNEKTPTKDKTIPTLSLNSEVAREKLLTTEQTIEKLHHEKEINNYIATRDNEQHAFDKETFIHHYKNDNATTIDVNDNHEKKTTSTNRDQQTPEPTTLTSTVLPNETTTDDITETATTESKLITELEEITEITTTRIVTGIEPKSINEFEEISNLTTTERVTGVKSKSVTEIEDIDDISTTESTVGVESKSVTEIEEITDITTTGTTPSTVTKLEQITEVITTGEVEPRFVTHFEETTDVTATEMILSTTTGSITEPKLVTAYEDIDNLTTTGTTVRTEPNSVTTFEETTEVSTTGTASMETKSVTEFVEVTTDSVARISKSLMFGDTPTVNFENTESTTDEFKTTELKFNTQEQTVTNSEEGITTQTPNNPTPPSFLETTFTSHGVVDKFNKTNSNNSMELPKYTEVTTSQPTTYTTLIKLRNISNEETTLPAFTSSSEDTFDTSPVPDPDSVDGIKDNRGKIAAIVISTVGAVSLILLAGLLYIMRKRQKRFNYKQRCRPVSLNNYSVDNISNYNSTRRKNERQSKRSYGNPAFDDPVAVSHPLNFLALSKFAANTEDVIAEFEEIPQITAKISELPEGCDTKNRYANVIPLPETRVFLQTRDGHPNSDYINANYVTGPKNTKAYYIACQGPMQNTVDDFWRMIWEQQSKVVLMITHFFENGVEKCVDYLPPSEVLDCNRLFGDFQVTLKKRDVKDKYIISNLQLKNMVSNSWREVTHFWYLGWPEKGVPAEENSLIAFLIEARSYMKSSTLDKAAAANGITNGSQKNETNPVVVHCSPGTGRTGVVIACDIAIREFEQARLVDIPKVVYRIRRDRASAVQTKEQYMFIYKVVSLYATKLTGGALDSM